jgi:hypothetical protein
MLLHTILCIFIRFFVFRQIKNHQQSYRYIAFDPAFPPAIVEITSKIETKFLALP